VIEERHLARRVFVGDVDVVAIEEIVVRHRREGRRETPEARAFDALVQTCDRPSDGGRGGRRVRREGLIRCDLGALRRGAVEGEEVCEVAGVGPVPVAQAVDLLSEATWKQLVTRGVDVLNVTTLSRKATAAMLAALAWRQPTCTAQGCGRTLVEIDHRNRGPRPTAPASTSSIRSVTTTTT
jgi:hypothetical protein